MLKKTLNGKWNMKIMQMGTTCEATVPGTVYSDLIQAHLMEDPYYGDNEMRAFSMMENDFMYERKFDVSCEMMRCDKIVLRCEGLDTVATIKINGVFVGTANNMHRTWEFSVENQLVVGENHIMVQLFSPLRAIEEKNSKKPLLGSLDAVQGFSHLRKSHCMFGWDWGPRLPDAGIWRNILLCGIQHARLKGVAVSQQHCDDVVTLALQPEIERLNTQETIECLFTITAPDGTPLCSNAHITEFQISNPKLWWPNGYGEQFLYEICARLQTKDGIELDTYSCKIGLRTLTICREKSAVGESFCHEINGVKIFAMGADYIPEDSILSRINAERTQKLLKSCKESNFNCVRVWGGGFYPDDAFYEACDALGLLVWQDFMFACAAYKLTDDFKDNVIAEVQDNVKRLRNHACLALWCGNNEMEWFTTQKRYVNTKELEQDYLTLFETVIPQALRVYDTQTFYWPASPSSGGHLYDPNSECFGDAHYWDVWHENKPFSDYRKHFFRYVSEFGFQSYPCRKTIDTFAAREEQNAFSYIMEKHQRNGSANGKIMNYLARTYLYPNNFDALLYASQLLQAEAIQYGVQHWRRNRGNCMGTLYWQLNDCWPVVSWSSIDYCDRWKALQYYAKRFYAPIAISCCEEGFVTQLEHINIQPQELANIRYAATLFGTNETCHSVSGSVCWQIRSHDGTILHEETQPITMEPLSAMKLADVPCEMLAVDINTRYLSYQLKNAQEIVLSEGTTILSLPKYFKFLPPKLNVFVENNLVVVEADSYAKSVEIYSDTDDFVLSDNFFDMNAGRKVLAVVEGHCVNLKARSVWNIR